MKAVHCFRKKFHNRWEKVFKDGPSEIFGRQPLKNFTWSIFKYFVPDVWQCSLMHLFKCNNNNPLNPAPQNDQTHSINSSAITDELFEYV